MEKLVTVTLTIVVPQESAELVGQAMIDSCNGFPHVSFFGWEQRDASPDESGAWKREAEIELSDDELDDELDAAAPDYLRPLLRPDRGGI